MIPQDRAITPNVNIGLNPAASVYIEVSEDSATTAELLERGELVVDLRDWLTEYLEATA